MRKRYWLGKLENREKAREREREGGGGGGQRERERERMTESYGGGLKYIRRLLRYGL